MTARSRQFGYFPQTLVFLLVVAFMILVSVNAQAPEYLSVVRNIPQVLTQYGPDTTSSIEPLVPGPVRRDGISEPTISARAALVRDRASGSTLYAKNEDLPLWPASTTKIMTALVAFDEYSLHEIVTVKDPVLEGRTMDLYDGERISVNNLLYGLLIHSANDAAFALADYHPDGRDAFISKMNEKARRLNLINTHFVDPAGFDDDKQYSTASDLASLTEYALKNETLAQIMSIPSITLSDADYIRFHKLTNVNQLLGTVPGASGGKTGYTENAKENLINTVTRDGHAIMTVVLGSDDRFGDSRVLTEWVYENFTWPELVPDP